MPDAEAQWAALAAGAESAAERVVFGLPLETAHDRLLALPPSDGTVTARLARAWLRAGRRETAREAFMCAARGIAHDPERADELRALGAELGDDEEAEDDVARALALFRALVPAQLQEAGAMPSPPPSPAPRDARAALALLQVLGRPAFDEPALEDARDRMVDLVRAHAGRRGVRAF